MSSTQARCLILACGNTLRGDDGVGLWLAEWAEHHFSNQPGVRILADHQWTPELAEDVARAHSVLFIDCSFASPPGAIKLTPVEPAASPTAAFTHFATPAGLLAGARALYGAAPGAVLVSVAGADFGLGGEISDPVRRATETLVRTTIAGLI